jgi:hypothetical protein
MSWLNSSRDIRSSFVEQRVHFGTPARGETLPPNSMLVTDAFRYLSCSRALLVVENREPHLEHLKNSSSSLGPDSMLSTVSSCPPQSIWVTLGGFSQKLENFSQGLSLLAAVFSSRSTCPVRAG